jgi:hypothetical protein
VFVIFWQKEIGTKAAPKMLVKLTSKENCARACKIDLKRGKATSKSIKKKKAFLTLIIFFYLQKPFFFSHEIADINKALNPMIHFQKVSFHSHSFVKIRCSEMALVYFSGPWENILMLWQHLTFYYFRLQISLT